ncbi:MAG: 7-cyano-7-deazaguanine synthase [Dehalococcoidia bacterium]|nr:7-cyano-7-deazaguanine synthase [Dehalococcoidia bacterium]
MSGILAVVDLRGDAVDVEAVRPQLDAIAHRGDRAPVLWAGGPVALGHVNLPTTPEAEHEVLPATYDGRYWITWDGRLDNREALARVLDCRPGPGEVVTDAQYVAAAYVRWGADFVDHLLGDWAVVIWDAREQKLVCAKDPLGWRALYWARQGSRIAVATEPCQLFAAGFVERRPNHDYLLRFLADALQQPNTTCYDGISELQGGQVLTIHRGSSTVRTYWDRPRTRRLPHRAPMEYVEEFRALFAEAMRARLRTNRKVGVFLSGGLDSSYVAAIAAQQGVKPLALTVFNPGTKWMDEREYAALVANHLGLEQRLVDLSDGWSLSSHVLGDETFDSPAHPPQAPSYVRLAQSAAENGIGVLFGGDGADEWLTGSPVIESELREFRFRAAWRMAQARRRGSPVRLLARSAYRAYVPFALRNGARELRLRNRQHPVRPFVARHSGWSYTATYPAAGGWSDREQLKRTWVLYRQHVGSLVGWRDRWAFSPNNLELRTPFNDLRVVEYLASVPHPVKQFRGRRKDLLREAEYLVLPAAIPDRDDFGLYQELLNDGARREAARREAAVDALARVAGVDHDAVRHEVERWVTDQHDRWEPNWRAITAGGWLTTFPPPADITPRTRPAAGPEYLKRKEVIPQ